MKTIETVDQVRVLSRCWRAEGKAIGLVPTMGALHEGHASLIRLARDRSDMVVVSVFVNPTQFGPSEDFKQYPRTFEADSQVCRREGVAAVFAPLAGTMYSEDFSTWVVEQKLSQGLCGRSRPEHFKGVTTVVSKLFNAVEPDVAVFGQKDAQQALIIQRMVRDLNFPVEIIIAPTVREPDGLAMSSRNAYLTPAEHLRALSVQRGLKRAEAAFNLGEKNATELARHVVAELEAVDARIDYVECVGRDSLQPLITVDRPALLAVAAFFGRTRLIDNVFLNF